MFISPIKFLFDKVCEKIYVGHLNKKIKMDVVEPDKIGQKMKNALEKEGMLKDLKNADYIIRFAEKIETQPPEEENPEEDSENTEETTDETPENSDSENTEDTEKDTEETTDDSTEDDTEDQEKDSTDSEEDEEDDKKKDKDEEDENDDEGLNESVKVQDLTSSMLSQPKKTKTSKNSSESKQNKSNKKSSECTDKNEDNKKCQKCKDKCEDKEDKKEITEAETQATGDDLKLRVQKTLASVFDLGKDKDKIELVDVKDCIPGYNVYYYKVSFKDTNDKDSKESEKSSEK